MHELPEIPSRQELSILRQDALAAQGGSGLALEPVATRHGGNWLLGDVAGEPQFFVHNQPGRPKGSMVGPASLPVVQVDNSVLVVPNTQPQRC